MEDTSAEDLLAAGVGDTELPPLGLGRVPRELGEGPLLHPKSFRVQKPVLLVDRAFVPCQKERVLTKMVKMTNLRSNQQSKGFAAQTPLK